MFFDAFVSQRQCAFASGHRLGINTPNCNPRVRSQGRQSKSIVVIDMDSLSVFLSNVCQWRVYKHRVKCVSLNTGVVGQGVRHGQLITPPGASAYSEAAANV